MKKFTLLNTFLIVLSLVFTLHINAQSSAVYNVTYQSNWNASEHTSIPTNDHYSNLVGATHKNENEYFEVGENASTGIKNVAEFGSNSAFMSEVENATNTKEWFNVSFSPNNASGTATITGIEVTEEHHLLTLVSMLAPSPDWFIAINSLDLRNATNTDWKDTFTLPVFAYDAGTDSGSDYASANQITSPSEAIYKINGLPFNGNKVGELTVTLISTSLSTADFKSINTLNVYPNPSLGKVSVSGKAVSKLKTIEIYNILGSKVKDLKVKNTNNRVNLNLSDLQKGVYLLRLFDTNGNAKTQKLALQ